MSIEEDVKRIQETLETMITRLTIPGTHDVEVEAMLLGILHGDEKAEPADPDDDIAALRERIVDLEADVGHGNAWQRAYTAVSEALGVPKHMRIYPDVTATLMAARQCMAERDTYRRQASNMTEARESFIRDLCGALGLNPATAGETRIVSDVHGYIMDRARLTAQVGIDTEKLGEWHDFAREMTTALGSCASDAFTRPELLGAVRVNIDALNSRQRSVRALNRELGEADAFASELTTTLGSYANGASTRPELLKAVGLLRDRYAELIEAGLALMTAASETKEATP